MFCASVAFALLLVSWLTSILPLSKITEILNPSIFCGGKLKKCFKK